MGSLIAARVEFVVGSKTSSSVMLDLRIPGFTGEEVLHSMKDENPDVKVVMASGFLDPEMRTVMAVTGVKRFVDKPYVLEELLVIFQSVIDGE
jgi:FixJ family two-component response regulator